MRFQRAIRPSTGGAYTASKAALLGLTDSLRLELQPFGVRVAHVTLGATR